MIMQEMGNPGPKPRAMAAAELLKSSSHMSLSTNGLKPEGGYPFASFVAAKAVEGGRVVMLLSALAEHGKNLAADPRCCVCAGKALGGAEIARVSVSGLAKRILADSAEAREFLSAHPYFAPMASFGDFSFWVVEPEAVRMVGGFGAAAWVSPSELARAWGEGLA